MYFQKSGEEVKKVKGFTFFIFAGGKSEMQDDKFNTRGDLPIRHNIITSVFFCSGRQIEKVKNREKVLKVSPFSPFSSPFFTFSLDS